MTGIPQREALALWLALIAGGDRTGLVEVRSRRAEGGMHQAFFRTTQLEPAVEFILGAGRRTDAYCGMAPRQHRHGGKAAIGDVWALWIDADTPAAVHALSAFEPVPSVIIKSGSITDGTPHAHAAWQLRQPLAREHVERANRRLAHALGADPKCAEAARILRPPGSANWKSGAPRPVEAIRVECTSFLAREIVGDLPDPPTILRPRARVEPRQLDANDPLHAIPAEEYAPLLLRQELGADRKLSCFHGPDTSPSLHVYPDDGGWTCFGCGRGGGIVELYAWIQGIDPSQLAARCRSGDTAAKREFVELRQQLARDLLGSIERAA